MKLKLFLMLTVLFAGSALALAAVNDVYVYRLGESDTGAGPNGKAYGTFNELDGPNLWAWATSFYKTSADPTTSFNLYPYYDATVYPFPELLKNGASNMSIYCAQPGGNWNETTRMFDAGTALCTGIPANAITSGDITSSKFGVEAWVHPEAPLYHESVMGVFKLSESINSSFTVSKFSLFIEPVYDEWVFQVQDDGDTANFPERTGQIFETYAKAQFKKWQHVALVYDNGTTTLYLNGQVAVDPAYGTPAILTGRTIKAPPQGLIVGALQTGYTNRGALYGSFKGNIDEVRLFTFTGTFDPNDLNYNSSASSATYKTDYWYRLGEGVAGAADGVAVVSPDKYGRTDLVVKDNAGNHLDLVYGPRVETEPELTYARPYYRSDVPPASRLRLGESTLSMNFKNPGGSWNTTWKSNGRGSAAEQADGAFGRNLTVTPTCMEAWVKPMVPAGAAWVPDPNARMNVMTLAEGPYVNSDQSNFSMGTKNGNWQFIIGGKSGTGGTAVDTGVAVQWDTWQHVAAAYDSGTQTTTFYVNGTLVKTYTATGALDVASNSVTVGGGHIINETNTRPNIYCAFNGLIDEARIFRFTTGGFSTNMLNCVPDPTDCAGVLAGGFELKADLEPDCVVNLLDLQVFAQSWLECNIPGNANCGL